MYRHLRSTGLSELASDTLSETLPHINDLYGLKVGLCIDRPEYFDHNDYTGRLTDNQLRSLYSYLSCPELEKTKWWYLLREWNEDNDNSKHAIPLDTPLPNYLELICKSQ